MDLNLIQQESRKRCESTYRADLVDRHDETALERPQEKHSGPIPSWVSSL